MKATLVGTHPLADVLERVILDAPDSEVLSAVSQEEVDEASRKLMAFVQRNTAVKAATSSRSAGTKATAARHGILIDFLQQLASSRPELSPRLQAMFSSDEEPSRADVERLAVELLKKSLDKRRV